MAYMQENFHWNMFGEEIKNAQHRTEIDVNDRKEKQTPVTTTKANSSQSEKNKKKNLFLKEKIDETCQRWALQDLTILIHICS